MQFQLRQKLPNDFRSRGWRVTQRLVELGVTLRTWTGVISATFPKIENVNNISFSKTANELEVLCFRFLLDPNPDSESAKSRQSDSG